MWSDPQRDTQKTVEVLLISILYPSCSLNPKSNKQTIYEYSFRKGNCFNQKTKFSVKDSNI